MGAEASALQSGGAEVRLASLAKHFGQVRAVDDVSLLISRGEFLTLLGPSGSGKTTTLMMIAGFEQPTAGEILIDGAPMGRVAAHRRGIGIVFQNYALFPHLSVRENIAFPLRARGAAGREIAERVTSVLRLVQLEGYEERMPNQLSGGQQQRVALARAVVFSPKLLLMDEPLGALDKKLRVHMQIELKQIQRALGVTVVYVTHDQEEALVLSDRIAVMSQGRIEQLGPPSVVYNRPSSRFVADFLGDSNFLSGMARAVEQDRVVVEVTGGGICVAEHAGRVNPGTPLELAIRPERMELRQAGQCENAWEGKIEQVVFLGDATRYAVRVSPELVLIAQEQNVGGRAPLEPGMTVRVSWGASDAVVV